MSMKTLLTFILALEASTGWAITYGVEDLNNTYPNAASVRGVTSANTTSGTCSGSLVARDAEKFVILTAAHCAFDWENRLAAGRIQSVGVSFNQNNVVNGSTSNATYYLRGGVPIANPLDNLKVYPGPKIVNDVGLVVFPIDAQDFNQKTLDEKYPGLPPIKLPPPGYLKSLVDSSSNPTQLLTFIAVGYGTGERFPIPSEEQGPATPQVANTATLPIRYIADHLSYSALSTNNSVLRTSQNIATGDNGACNGDSGGPIFYKDATLGLLQVSIISGGDIPCRSTSVSPVLDIPSSVNSKVIACAFVPGDANAVRACVDAIPLN